MNAMLRTENGRCVLRFERRLAHSPEKVWRALTERDEQKHWFPAELDIDPRVGGTIDWVGPDGDVWSSGTVTVWDPPRVFEHLADGERLRFELRPEDDGAACLLLFTHAFDDRAGSASFAAGWHGCLDGLERWLAGAADPETPYQWAEQHEIYFDEFGLLEGTTTPGDDGHVVRFERVFTQPVDAVWATLMSSAEPGTEVAQGARPPIAFTHGFDTAGPIDRVDEALPAPTKWGETGKLLEYGWSLEGAPGGNVCWEIVAGPGGMARVILTQTVPDALAEHRITALAAWHTHLELLAEHLAGRTPCWPDDRTKQLLDHYSERVDGSAG